MNLIDLMFIALYVIFPLLIAYIMKKTGNPLTGLSVPSFIIVSLIMLSYVGYFPLYFGLDEYRYEIGIKNQSVILESMFYTGYSIVMIIIGFVYFSRFFRNDIFKPPNVNKIKSLNQKEIFWLFILLVVVLFVLMLYISKIDRLAVFVAFTSDAYQAKLARSDMANNFAGKYHWYSLFMHQLSSLISFIFFSSWLITKRKIIGLLTLISFSITSFSMLMTTEKAPIVWFILGMHLSYVLTKKSGKLSFRGIIPVVIIGFCVLLFADITFMGSKDLDAAISSVISRALNGGTGPSYFYLEYFPVHHDYLLGRSFPNPGGILPFEPYLLTVEVANWAFPHLLDSGIISTSPAVFWAELYANFGILGILIGPIFVSFFIAFLVHNVNKIRTSSISIGLTSWMMLHYKDLSVTGASEFVFDTKLFILIFLILIVSIISNGFKLKLNKKIV